MNVYRPNWFVRNGSWLYYATMFLSCIVFGVVHVWLAPLYAFLAAAAVQFLSVLVIWRLAFGRWWFR